MCLSPPAEIGLALVHMELTCLHLLACAYMYLYTYVLVYVVLVLYHFVRHIDVTPFMFCQRHQYCTFCVLSVSRLNSRCVGIAPVVFCQTLVNGDGSAVKSTQQMGSAFILCYYDLHLFMFIIIASK